MTHRRVSGGRLAAAVIIVGLTVAGCASPGPAAPDPPGQPRDPFLESVLPDSLEAEKRRRAALLVRTGTEPVAAGELGFYLDIQEGRLRQQLGAAGFSVERRDAALGISLAGYLTFDNGSAELLDGANGLLEAIGVVLAEFDRSLITIHGHTDDSGSEAINRRLSGDRARALAQYLAGHGVARSRILVVAHGEHQPLASNATEAGRQINRRLVLDIEPVVQPGGG